MSQVWQEIFFNQLVYFHGCVCSLLIAIVMIASITDLDVVNICFIRLSMARFRGVADAFGGAFTALAYYFYRFTDAIR